MGLSLEMRKSATTKKLESLRRKRGAAVVDEDNGAFAVLSKEIAEVENDLAAIDQALGEGNAESRRRWAADEPRRRAEARARLIADLDAAEKKRLAAVGRAEKAARDLAAA